MLCTASWASAVAEKPNGIEIDRVATAARKDPPFDMKNLPEICMQISFLHLRFHQIDCESAELGSI
jgi:hypothetical protein